MNRSAEDEAVFLTNQVSRHIGAVICKMPHYADGTVGMGKTAVSLSGHTEPRPDDNACRLEFLYPTTAGRRDWFADGRVIFGEEKFKVFFLYGGPMLVVMRGQTTRLFEATHVQDLCRHLNTLLGVREPIAAV